MAKKKWVRVRLKDGRQSFFPSFEDLWRMIQAIAECEDEKYPNGSGRFQLFAFLHDCVGRKSWERLRAEHKIPDRGFRSVDKLEITIEEIDFEERAA